MEVYCAHSSAQKYGVGGYNICGLCGAEWYDIDPAPICLIGHTDIEDVDRFPFIKKGL